LAYAEATPNGRTVVNRLTYGERAMTTRLQLSQIRWIDLEEDKAARAVVFGLLAEMSGGRHQIRLKPTASLNEQTSEGDLNRHPAQVRSPRDSPA
jgi:hypothetical protein